MLRRAGRWCRDRYPRDRGCGRACCAIWYPTSVICPKCHARDRMPTSSYCGPCGARDLRERRARDVVAARRKDQERFQKRHKFPRSGLPQRCGTCQIVKRAEEFPSNPARSSGLHLWCRDCQRPMKFAHQSNQRTTDGLTLDWHLLSIGPCVYCGSDRDPSWDHVIPLSRGGPNSIENIVTCCGTCNRSKRRRTPDEWLSGISI